MTAKTIRAQLAVLRPLLEGSSLELRRKAQNMLGEMMGAKQRRQVVVKDHPFAQFEAAWIVPKDERRQGVVLYLHGGGYTCGDLEYAKGVGIQLCTFIGSPVFAIAYRLAPEHPFPAAIEDALESYRYLLSKGYAPEHIALCGESAGGGLCYALCQKLRQEGLPMPGSIVAISPWTDMTASGASYEENREKDPSITLQMLNRFAKQYAADPKDPLASPLFADCSQMPPSLIFVGADEIMRSDAQGLHEKLIESGCESQLVIAPERWHAYLLYGLAEDRKDLSILNRFLNRYMCEERKLRWLPLDNAAKIYPAARRENWTNLFRLSASLDEAVDVAVLQSALDVTVRRFPSIAARLRRGLFWYYLQQLERAPAISREYSYPLTRMDGKELRKCAFRVIAYQNRIAVEFFHSLTDGNGGMVFLKSLVAEYLQQKHGARIPAEQGVLGRLEEPTEAELEDSFQKYAGNLCASRKENDAWHLEGELEPDGFLHVTCLQIPAKAMVEKAHEYGASVSEFLGALMMMALQTLQAEKVPDVRKRKPIKVLLPINLRRLFPSKTVRNFALYITPEIQPRLGWYDLPEICRLIHHRMGVENTAKHMSTRIATNVGDEQSIFVKLIPLFLKNMVMKAVFDSVGEVKSCLSLSNLGVVNLPDEMKPYICRMDFVLGTQATAPYNCGVLTYGDTMYVNFTRNTRHPELEAHFYRVLQGLGLPVQAQDNGQER